MRRRKSYWLSPRARRIPHSPACDAAIFPARTGYGKNGNLSVRYCFSIPFHTISQRYSNLSLNLGNHRRSQAIHLLPVTVSPDEANRLPSPSPRVPQEMNRPPYTSDDEDAIREMRAGVSTPWPSDDSCDSEHHAERRRRPGAVAAVRGKRAASRPPAKRPRPHPPHGACVYARARAAPLPGAGVPPMRWASFASSAGRG
jgi:hypothetical protein